jgi:hypothetical protein
MPNISETSVSDINLSPVCSVMIIFFLCRCKISDPASRSSSASFDPIAMPASRVCRLAEYRGSLDVNHLSHEAAACGREDDTMAGQIYLVQGIIDATTLTSLVVLGVRCSAT